MRDYRKLDCWRRSHLTTLDVYRVTARFPREERYGLTDQMRRAAASVPMNIAEGAGRDSAADYDRFLGYAASSLNELEYQLRLAWDLHYIGVDTAGDLTREVREVRAMLTALRKRVNPA